jgi:hypothetical protein
MKNKSLNWHTAKNNNSDKIYEKFGIQ